MSHEEHTDEIHWQDETVDLLHAERAKREEPTNDYATLLGQPDEQDII